MPLLVYFTLFVNDIKTKNLSFVLGENMNNLKLVTLTPNYADKYISLIKKETSSKISDYATGFLVKNEKEFCNLLEEYNNRGSRILGILDQKESLIGAIALENLFLGDTYEVAFFIGQQYRGNHYASQALALLIQKLKNTQIKNLAFIISSNNKTSLNIVKLLGAKFDHFYEDTEEVHKLEI